MHVYHVFFDNFYTSPQLVLLQDCLTAIIFLSYLEWGTMAGYAVTERLENIKLSHRDATVVKHLCVHTHVSKHIIHLCYFQNNVPSLLKYKLLCISMIVVQWGNMGVAQGGSMVMVIWVWHVRWNKTQSTLYLTTQTQPIWRMHMDNAKYISELEKRRNLLALSLDLFIAVVNQFRDISNDAHHPIFWEAGRHGRTGMKAKIQCNQVIFTDIMNY